MDIIERGDSGQSSRGTVAVTPLVRPDSHHVVGHAEKDQFAYVTEEHLSGLQQNQRMVASKNDQFQESMIMERP